MITQKQKRFIIGTVCAIFSLPSFAQVGELRNNISVGFNGGVNINSVSFTPDIRQGSLTGMTGGFTARYISEKYFAMICGIQVEINYSQHGWKDNLEGVDAQYSRTMNYLEIPLLAHLAFGRDHRGLRFFLNLGPQVGFLISESDDRPQGWVMPDNAVKEQYNKWADNKFDYGITGGMGVELRTNAGNFLVEGRYYFALSDFYGNTKKDYFSRSAHSAIQAKLTYLFDLRR